MSVFKLNIGDISNDGHGRGETFFIEANFGVDTVRAAWAEARDLFPRLDPTTFMNDYEDVTLPKDVWLEAKALGYDLLEGLDITDLESVLAEPQIGPEDMAKYTLWFIGLGRPDLELKIMEVQSLTREFIGYGLFVDY